MTAPIVLKDTFTHQEKDHLRDLISGLTTEDLHVIMQILQHEIDYREIIDV